MKEAIRGRERRSEVLKEATHLMKEAIRGHERRSEVLKEAIRALVGEQTH